MSCVTLKLEDAEEKERRPEEPDERWGKTQEAQIKRQGCGRLSNLCSKVKEENGS